MKRSEFLKKLGIGLGVAVITPTLLKAEEVISPKELNFAVDIKAIEGLTMNGRNVSPADVLQLWKQTGVLVYDSNKGNAPVVFQGEVDVVDIKNYAH